MFLLFFGLELPTDIHATRAKCNHCNRMAPSQAASLQHNQSYLHIRFRASGWLFSLENSTTWWLLTIGQLSKDLRSTNGALGLINTLRRTSATFGIPDELTSDVGPEFIAHTTRQFLAEWGIQTILGWMGDPSQTKFSCLSSQQLQSWN